MTRSALGTRLLLPAGKAAGSATTLVLYALNVVTGSIGGILCALEGMRGMRVELAVRTYYEARCKRIYTIRELLAGDEN